MKKRKRKNDYLVLWLQGLLALLITALFIVSWGNISWMFNYHVLSQYLSGLFTQQTPAAITPPVTKPVNPAAPATPQNPAATPAAVPVETKPRRDMITIPKISITAPIITAQNNNSDAVHKLLDSGVVLYPGSVEFGKSGQTVILGHSAPVGWPKIKYDSIFSEVNKLLKGDLVVITYNYKTYYYKVVKTRVVTPEQGVPEPSIEGNSLMLVSCWPPGKDYKRIVIETAIY